MSKRAKEGQLPAIYGTSTNTPQDQGRLPCQNVHQQAAPGHITNKSQHSKNRNGYCSETCKRGAAPGHIRHFNQYPLKSGILVEVPYILGANRPFLHSNIHTPSSNSPAPPLPACYTHRPQCPYHSSVQSGPHPDKL